MTHTCSVQGNARGKLPVSSDSHMHTAFSTDSSTPVRSMLDEAVRRGLDSVCITDHLDLDFPPDEELGPDPFRLDLASYWSTLSGIREEYRGRLNVRIGIEIGLQSHLGKAYKEIVNRWPFDFVIGSLHLVNGMDPYYGKAFEGRTDADVYRDAFRETLECISRVRDFDSLGHLDYVVRYGRNKAQEYSYRRFADEIDAVLKKLIEEGKGLEMNMGGFKYGLGFCNPHPDVLKRYRELGGEIVTVGADAHRPEHVAYAYERAGEILSSCGFRYYAVFEGRRPVFYPVGG